MMDKTADTEFRRVFLTEGLPEPLTPASSHLQLFDNYIENTRLRIRKVRIPETREWAYFLQQVIRKADIDPKSVKMAEILLDETEYTLFEQFEGGAIRKNRYFHEYEGRVFIFDVFLGDLWGVSLAMVEFQYRTEAAGFEPPPFAVFEVTADSFFFGENLYGKKFDEVRAEVKRLEREKRELATSQDVK